MLRLLLIIVRAALIDLNVPWLKDSNDLSLGAWYQIRKYIIYD